MDLSFSKYIKLPGNLTKWTSENEGANRIEIEMVQSESTKWMLDDQDLSLEMSWKVDSVNIKEY